MKQNAATNQPLHWSGIIQERMQQGRLWRLGNALSDLRAWIWRRWMA